MLVETNTKWNTITTNKMKYKIKDLYRATAFIFADSKSYTATKIQYLLGRIVNIMQGVITNMIDKQSIYINRLEKWTAF